MTRLGALLLDAAPLSTGVRIATGPFVVRLRSDITTLLPELRRLYGDFSVVENGIVDFDVEVRRASGVRRWWRPQALFTIDGRILFRPFPVAAVLPLLEWGLNWCIARRAHRFLIVHAAVVERGGRAVVLPGRPGSGKSTLCAGLAHRGWRLLSDEFALVVPETAEIAPLPRPISLKGAAIDAVRAFASDADIGPAVPTLRKGLVAYVRPPRESVLASDRAARPQSIVFPTYERGAAPRLDPLSRGTALVRLADNSYNYNVLGRRGFEALAALAERCTAHDLRFGSLEEAVRLLDDLHDPTADGERHGPGSSVLPRAHAHV